VFLLALDFVTYVLCRFDNQEPNGKLGKSILVKATQYVVYEEDRKPA